MLRKLYRTYIHWPRLDAAIYTTLDSLTDALARLRHFSFPEKYIRRWKLTMLREQYEPETVALCKKILRPGMTAVDIGAHIGYFTRLFSKLVGPSGRVYAFEADPENYTLLVRNARGRKNIRPVHLAIAEKSGLIDFYHYDDKSGSHSTLANVPLEFKKRKLAIACGDLDSYLARAGAARVDVIKMDIEGGEGAALTGMERTLETPRLQLIIEFAPAWIEAAGASPNEFLERLASYGFEIFGVTSNGLVKLRSVRDASFAELLPKPAGRTRYASEFINLYCVKNAQ